MERQWPDGPPQELRTRNSVQHGRLSAFAPPSPLAWRCSALRTPFGRVLAPPALRASAVRKAHLRCFLLHWAHRRLLHPQFAMVVLLRPTACSTPLLIGLTTACFAHCARPSCAPLAAPSLSPSLGSSYRPALRWPGIPGLRTPFGRVLAPPPLRGFDGYGLFRALRAAKLRPTARALRAPLWPIPPSRLRRATSLYTREALG